ncbi:hypothetical protein BJA5080_03412 [Bradyrhizobium diazoefficiens SEMIA 5080]|uniref:Uncharacterized protein n=1 Tax=Bradyrhizobium diazoefficiens SEMIA 5080 TaxID=754504 RepID=A0A837CDH9_9BRAD|nr:hypothetical protein BJA5080_03412 [Bradyrhizobium diazoefficiens SEMIA 5080]
MVDPPATTTSSSTSTTISVTSSGTSTTTSGDGRSWGQSHYYAAQSFNNHPDFARAATTLSDTGASNVGSTPTMTTTDSAAGAGAKAYAS